MMKDYSNGELMAAILSLQETTAAGFAKIEARLDAIGAKLDAIGTKAPLGDAFAEER